MVCLGCYITGLGFCLGGEAKIYHMGNQYTRLEDSSVHKQPTSPAVVIGDDALQARLLMQGQTAPP